MPFDDTCWSQRERMAYMLVVVRNVPEQCTSMKQVAAHRVKNQEKAKTKKCVSLIEKNKKSWEKVVQLAKGAAIRLGNET